MIADVNPKLAERLDSLFTDIAESIVSDLLSFFVYRAIPAGNPECDDFVEYLGKTVYTKKGTLKSFPEVNYEAGQILRATIENLDDSDRFVLDCYFVENGGEIPSEDDILHAIMEHLDTVLYDIGHRVVEGD